MKQFMMLAQTSLGSFKDPGKFVKNANTQDGALAGVETFISHVLGLITVVGSVFFIINFFLAALSWLTAQGDAGKIQKSRDQMIQGVVGLVIIVGSYGIIGLIGTIVGLNLLSPKEALLQLPIFK